MPRSASAPALAVLLGACQTPVERCNARPDDPACIPDAGTVGGLTYRSVRIEVGDDRTTDVLRGLCGNFVREVVWLMPSGVPADGFVVQQVDIESTDRCSLVPMEDSLDHLDACTDPPTAETLPPRCVRDGEPRFDRSDVRAWEAFPMEAGAVRYVREDRWELFPQAIAEGRATITGAARFYTAAELGGRRAPGPPRQPISDRSLHRRTEPPAEHRPRARLLARRPPPDARPHDAGELALLPGHDHRHRGGHP